MGMNADRSICLVSFFLLSACHPIVIPPASPTRRYRFTRPVFTRGVSTKVGVRAKIQRRTLRSATVS